MTPRGNRKRPESGIHFKILEKTQYLMNTLYNRGALNLKILENTNLFNTSNKKRVEEERRESMMSLIEMLCLFLFNLYLSVASHGSRIGVGMKQLRTRKQTERYIFFDIICCLNVFVIAIISSFSFSHIP